VRSARVEHAAFMAFPHALHTRLEAAGELPLAALLSWLSLPLTVHAAHRVLIQTGRLLNVALAETGQTALAFSAPFALGMALAR